MSPAVTATLGVCAVTTTSRISATVTLTVLEVVVVATVPTLYVTSAVLLIVGARGNAHGVRGTRDESERQRDGDCQTMYFAVTTRSKLLSIPKALFDFSPRPIADEGVKHPTSGVLGPRCSA